MYTGSPETEFLPYLASTLAPTVPLFIYGRDAPRTGCPPKEALWHAWKDEVLPFILASRTPADTLFIIAEADWVFSESHETACKEYLERTNRKWVLCDPPPERPAGGGGRGRFPSGASDCPREGCWKNGPRQGPETQRAGWPRNGPEGLLGEGPP